MNNLNISMLDFMEKGMSFHREYPDYEVKMVDAEEINFYIKKEI